MPFQHFLIYFYFHILWTHLEVYFKQHFATWLSQNFFFLPIFDNLVATIPIFPSSLSYNFGNLVITVGFLSIPSPSDTLLDNWTVISESKNFDNEINEIQAFSLC